MIYAKDSKTTVNSHFCSLEIKSTMGFRGHLLYYIHIEKTGSKQFIHIGATNIHSFLEEPFYKRLHRIWAAYYSLLN